MDKRIYVLGEWTKNASLEHPVIHEAISVGMFRHLETGEPLCISIVLEDGSYAFVDASMLERTIERFNRGVGEWVEENPEDGRQRETEGD